MGSKCFSQGFLALLLKLGSLWLAKSNDPSFVSLVNYILALVYLILKGCRMLC